MERVRKKRVGLLGGTFNPVHLGHLALAHEARRAFALDEVRLMPCGQPPHKRGDELATVEDRWEMLKRAVAGEPGLTLSSVELDRAGITYTVDTLRRLQEAEPDTEWYFIIGADTLPELQTWREIDQLLPLCHFITMRRPGMPEPDSLKQSIQLPDPWPERLMAGLFEGRLLDIASRDIRARQKAGESIAGLVPEAVKSYISEHNVYNEGDKTD